MTKSSSIHWAPRISLASLPTPLQPLKRLSDQLDGPRIWVKRDDLTGSLLSGNKVRKLEFTVAHALGQGHDLLITCGGLQSNHCRATAFVGAQLGIPVHLVLRGAPESADGNLLLDHLAGASVHCYKTSEYQQNLRAILEYTAEECRQQGYNPYIIPTGASDGVGVWGYFAACAELQQDFIDHQFEPDLIVMATGSGGTQAGLTLGSRYFNLGCDVLGMAVCDDAAYFARKVESDIADFSEHFKAAFDNGLSTQYSIKTNDDYIDDGYGIASDQVLQTIIDIASKEGILLDPVYTGKAFHGLINEIKKGNLGHMKNIVFIHTGGGYGVFPYRERLEQLIKS